MAGRRDLAMTGGGLPVLVAIDFDGEVIAWRGPAPFVFVAIPDAFAGEIAYAARQASYGWGVVPVEARIGEVAFTTSLFPRDGGYLLPVKAQVQKRAGVCVGDRVAVGLTVRGR